MAKLQGNQQMCTPRLTKKVSFLTFSSRKSLKICVLFTKFAYETFTTPIFITQPITADVDDARCDDVEP